MKQTVKDSAVKFLQMVVSNRVEEAYDLFLGEKFIHHNAWFKGDKQSLQDAMAENAIQNPDKIFSIKRVIHENDVVAVHSHLKQTATDIGVSVVHIFRFEAQKIVEMWDVIMAIPEDAVNENGLF